MRLTPPAYREVRFTTGDGLELYARDYDNGNAGPSVLGLCGLTRNSRDFDPLAPFIADRCRLIVIDYRGRGHSAYATDAKTYRPDVELADSLQLLDILVVTRVGVIGTSRGGLVAMVMGSAQPERLAGVVLNDIGPVIERDGLLRIQTYLGKSPPLQGWGEAVASLRRTHPGFANLSDDEWLAFAKRLFRSDNGVPHVDYDPQLAEAFPSRETIESGKAPDLWPMFDSLNGLPVTVLRGENSDLLSEATVHEMKRRHPSLVSVIVKDRGHPPFLDEPECVDAIRQWITQLR